MTCIDKLYLPLRRTKNKTKQLLFSKQYKAVAVQLKTGQTDEAHCKDAKIMSERDAQETQKQRISCMSV